MTDRTETLLDCGLILPRRHALVIGDQLAQRGVDMQVLSRAVVERGGRRGVRTLRSVLDRLDPKSESAGETLTRDCLWEWGIEAPISQFALSTSKGPYRADFAWPHLKLILEFDGQLKYDGAAPASDVVIAERFRERALRDAGWTILRTDWDEVFKPSMVLRHRLTTTMDRLRAGRSEQGA